MFSADAVAKTALAVADDEDVGTALSLPTLDEQRTENKAWQDVFDTPAAKKAESSSLLQNLRSGFPGPEGRIESADKLKGEANNQFGEGRYDLALRSYITGLWLLRLDDPPVPKVLLNPEAPNGPGLLRLLNETAAAASVPPPAAAAAPDTPAAPAKSDIGGVIGGADSGDGGDNGGGGDGGGGSDVDGNRDGGSETAANDDDDDALAAAIAAAAIDGAIDGIDKGIDDCAIDAEATRALDATRSTLQLNVAAAAIKLEDWSSARLACELVLSTRPTHPKALYRLAQAHEGAGDLSAAISVLSSRLLKQQPAHREAQKLVASLRSRSGAERKMFGGLFERAQVSSAVQLSRGSPLSPQVPACFAHSSLTRFAHCVLRPLFAHAGRRYGRRRLVLCECPLRGGAVEEGGEGPAVQD